MVGNHDDAFLKNGEYSFLTVGAGLQEKEKSV